MEMKIVITGAGACIPKSELGINILSYSYISLRNTKTNPPVVLALSDAFSIGSKSGTIVLGFVETNWFSVNPVKHSWLTNYNSLIGKKAEIEVSGTLLVFGSIDVKFKLYDKDDETKEILAKVDVKSHGGQLSTTTVRGVLIKMTP